MEEETRWWHLGKLLQAIAVLIAIRATLLLFGVELTIPYLDDVLLKILSWLERLGQMLIPNV